MPDTVVSYVLDSFALLAYFQAEPGSEMVRSLIEAVRDEQAALYMSLINVGELYYIAHRRRGSQQANEMIGDLRRLPVTLCAATEDRIMAAALIKATHLLSYADAFAVALTQEFNASLVTGDPEFRAVKASTPIIWLPER